MNIRDPMEKIMLFDLALGGHHGNYIQHLIDYAHKTAWAGEINVVVLPKFLEIHKDTIAAISSCNHPKVNLILISSEEAAALNSRQSTIRRTLCNFQEWQIFCKYAKKLQITHALLMYLDTYELPLALGLPSPCPFSGIYFRPPSTTALLQTIIPRARKSFSSGERRSL